MIGNVQMKVIWNWVTIDVCRKFSETGPEWFYSIFKLSKYCMLSENVFRRVFITVSNRRTTCIFDLAKNELWMKILIIWMVEYETVISENSHQFLYSENAS